MYPKLLSRFFGIVLMLLIAACSSSNQTQDVQHYVGQVEGTDAFIGLVTDGSQITAYVCDGTDTTISILAWFKGSLSENAFTLVNDNNLTLTGKIDSGKASGSLSLADGSQHAFVSEIAEGSAGVFREEKAVNGDVTVTGWIVLPNQEYRGGFIISGSSAIVGGPPAIVGGPPAIKLRLAFALP